MILQSCAKCGADVVGKDAAWLEDHRRRCLIGMGHYFGGMINGYWPILDTSPDLSEGQTGKLKNSRLPFKITKVDGDDITIRYLNSRQDWVGKKADLAEVAEFDAVS